MAVHKDFPHSPYEILDPSIRWFPGEQDLFAHGYEKLLPPLVAKLRKKVQEWRNADYDGASGTSKALLKWWFVIEHPVLGEDGTYSYFQYYFAQREAVEAVEYEAEDLPAEDSSEAGGEEITTKTIKDYLKKEIENITEADRTEELEVVKQLKTITALEKEIKDLRKTLAEKLVDLDRKINIKCYGIEEEKEGEGEEKEKIIILAIIP